MFVRREGLGGRERERVGAQSVSAVLCAPSFFPPPLLPLPLPVCEVACAGGGEGERSLCEGVPLLFVRREGLCARECERVGAHSVSAAVYAPPVSLDASFPPSLLPLPLPVGTLSCSGEGDGLRLLFVRREGLCGRECERVGAHSVSVAVCAPLMP